MSDAAITTIVSGAITIATMLFAWLNLRTRMRYAADKADEAAKKAAAVEKKLDDNTQLTKKGTEAVATNAKKAEEANNEKVGLLKEIAEQTNGKLGQNVKDAVSAAMQPLQIQLMEHDKICDDDRVKINQIISIMDGRLTTIEKYAHDSRHNLNEALQTQAVKLDLILKLINKGT